ncbi:MAG: Rieske 2Fe-2S domain-containing protein, partial [bacterium]
LEGPDSGPTFRGRGGVSSMSGASGSTPEPAPDLEGAVFRVPLDALLRKQGRRVASPWGELAVFLLSDGSARAVLNRCPHRGGSLAEGIVCGSHVFCTQHDWEICLDTGRAGPPDEGTVRAFRASVSGDSVLVTAED